MMSGDGAGPSSTPRQDSPEPSDPRPSSTPRLISQLLPNRPSQIPSSSQHNDASSSSRKPLRSTPRLSHPLPPPPSAFSLSSPAPKRPRFSDPQSSSANGASTAKPLSAMARPIPAPSTSSPARSFVSTQTTPLKPLRQPSVQEFQSLIPPRPPSPPPTAHNRLNYDINSDALNPRNHLPVEDPAPVFHALPWKSKHLLSGFKSFDQEFERIARSAQLSSQLNNETPMAEDDVGLPSGSLVEVVGPPGSGKSRFCVQMAVSERLRSLLQARTRLTSAHTNGTNELTPPRSTSGDAELFAEEFWDAEMASADQTLLIDCEGALQAECINDAVWAAVLTLWEKHRPVASVDTSFGRLGAPEVVRRLVAAVLGGVHTCRATTAAELVATLFRLRPSDDFDQAQGQMPINKPALLRPSLIVIDSLSHLLRITGSTAKERKQATYLNELVQHCLARLQHPFEREVTGEEDVRDTPESLSLCAPTIVITNQLGVRRAKTETSGSYPPSRTKPRNSGGDLREGGSLLVPQLQGLQLASQTRAQERPAPSVALSGPEMWDDDDTLATPLRGPRLDAHLGHDRGWAPSFLGPEVWRILLFRHGSSGHRSAQVVSLPTSTQTDLNRMWEQARNRQREAEPGSDAPPDTQELIRTLEQIRQSLFKWRSFLIDSSGHVEEQGT